MRRRICAGLLATGLLLAGSRAMDGAAQLRDRVHAAFTPCHEEDPCWDCTTMGNRQCGPAHR